MDSPVQIPFKSFIKINPDDPTAIYLQLVFEFIKAIQTGMLPEGTKLPGTRVLCRLFSINRNTLIKAFQDLEAQGYIEVRANKGTYILSGQRQKTGRKPTLQGADSNSILNGFKFERSPVLENPDEASNLPYRFNDGSPDLRLIHTDVMARLYMSKLKSKRNIRSWEQIQNHAHSNFKTQFANFLNITRCLRISTADLLTASSHEISLYLVTKVMIKAGDIVVIASPGYYQSTMTLSDSGARIIPVPTHNDGIDTDALRKVCESQQIRLLYLTSNYHYPTTVSLSAKKRMEILDMAGQYGFVILEDDYDFDFHYDNNPSLPLAAFDSHKKVIYVGSFGKSLPSGFGYGFIVAPPDFIQELEKHQNILEPGIDVMKEQVLSDWIKDGEVHRLSKKNKKVYKGRRDHFVTLLRTKLQGKIRFHLPQRGFAIWVEWLEHFNLIQFQKACASNGLFLPNTILYQNKNLTATRLGFAHLNEEEQINAVERLVTSLTAVTSNSVGTRS